MSLKLGTTNISGVRVAGGGSGGSYIAGGWEDITSELSITGGKNLKARCNGSIVILRATINYGATSATISIPAEYLPMDFAISVTSWKESDHSVQLTDFAYATTEGITLIGTNLREANFTIMYGITDMYSISKNSTDARFEAEPPTTASAGETVAYNIKSGYSTSSGTLIGATVKGETTENTYASGLGSQSFIMPPEDVTFIYSVSGGGND